MTRVISTTRAVEAAAEMFAYAAELGARKRAHPGDDIATSLLQAEVDGERLTDMEFNFFFMLLINAGGDTTRNLVAAGICVLMDHPEERAKLEAARSPFFTHFCLGANLARAEAAALVPEVLSRMKNIELAGPVERMPSTTINSIHSMPVRFTPARRNCASR